MSLMSRQWWRPPELLSLRFHIYRIDDLWYLICISDTNIFAGAQEDIIHDLTLLTSARTRIKIWFSATSFPPGPAQLIYYWHTHIFFTLFSLCFKFNATRHSCVPYVSQRSLSPSYGKLTLIAALTFYASVTLTHTHTDHTNEILINIVYIICYETKQKALHCPKWTTFMVRYAFVVVVSHFALLKWWMTRLLMQPKKFNPFKTVTLVVGCCSALDFCRMVPLIIWPCCHPRVTC